MKKLGIIGGVSWHSSLEYYKLLNLGISEQLGEKHSARVVLSSLDFADLLAWQKNKDSNILKQEFLAEGRRLKACGCSGFIIASHTLSWLGDYIQSEIGLEHVSLYSSLFRRLNALNAKTIGLVGTRYTMGDNFYRELYERAGFAVKVPNPPYFGAIAEAIYRELVYGVFKSETRQTFQSCFEHLAERGSDAIVLGCTEIGLLVRERQWVSQSSSQGKPIELIDLIETHVAECIEWMLHYRCLHKPHIVR